MKKATHQQTRNHNTRLVLKTIYDRGKVSRADISRTTHLTRASVSNIAAQLISEGLVAEVGQGPSVGGKPPTLLSVVDDSRDLIVIDLANGELRGSVLNLRGKIRHRTSLPVTDRSCEGALALVYELIDQLMAVADQSRLLGIGIGAPGLMDSARGMVVRSVAFDWQHLPLGEILEQRYSQPVHLANDCNAAAMAEYTFGSHRHVANLVVIKVGRGAGAGLMINNRLYQGDSSGAGEIGHMVVVDGGELCKCGRRGCLETLVNSDAIIRRACAIARNYPESLIYRYVDDPDEITIEVVLQALEAGEERLQPVITEAGRYLGVVTANLTAVLNISSIVLAGTVTRFGQTLLDAVAHEINQRSLPGLTGETSVTISELGADIVVLGAAALLLAKELEIA
jgi:predicted NBD/HSP70 family sugar kinase